MEDSCVMLYNKIMELSRELQGENITEQILTFAVNV